ncbi:T9SS type A sorting domain-containing protein [Rhodocytophaga aerolata]|uniref:T9SS type A sorting domain-containing protein n=1 Tax=Rhodocytophaga aerolata TaxID=455078 RepID=A0ABT8R553_9BACT|nr:T9SS type A sorting domain-containing protein [Rhodocytophaga aerolata]MDO1447213.1 T9SS type A sorting domain-containing protein [Rhodocytophaga aerolata]
MKSFFFIFICTVACSFSTYGTHLKGAELTAKPILGSSFTYTFTLIFYGERVGVNEGSNTLAVENGVEVPLTFISEEKLDEGLAKIIYTATYTYAAAGIYLVSYTGGSRNHVVNMTDGSTTRFYIELPLFINQVIGLNSSPVFSTPPKFSATAGEKFTDEYGAIDAEGDSLVYKLVTPPAVAGYVFPHEAGGNTGNTFDINPSTGTITWDMPVYVGKYVLVVQIEEWRQGVKIGLTYRDIEISVTGSSPVTPPTAEERTFTIYPNPADDKLYINVPESTTETIAEIWSIKGQLLIRKQLQSSGHADGVIHIQHLPAGVYILKVVSLNGYVTSRLIIMRN